LSLGSEKLLNVISLLGSTIEVDGLRAIVVTVSASTNNSVELFYVMVDNAEADVFMAL
jgi:hypothetical protein